jgi:hypothetical protein
MAGSVSEILLSVREWAVMLVVGAQACRCEVVGVAAGDSGAQQSAVHINGTTLSIYQEVTQLNTGWVMAWLVEFGSPDVCRTQRTLAPELLP